MITKVRENIFLGDENVTQAEIREAGITVVEIVDQITSFNIAGCQLFAVDLYADRINKPHVKDIACHIVKYMIQNGESVLVVDKTGLTKAAYVVARAICEVENRSIYDVFMEMKQILKDSKQDLDIGKAYL